MPPPVPLQTGSPSTRWLALAAAVPLTAFSLYVLSRGDGAGFRTADPISYLLTGIGTLSIATAMWRPASGLLVAAVTSTLLAYRDDHVDVLPFIVTVLLFAVGSYHPRSRALLGLGAAIVGLAATALSRPADLGTSALLQTTLIFVVAWVLGCLAHDRHERLLALIDAAEQRAASERDRSALARVEERLRIARELHDVLAHSISVISVQSTVGEHLAASDGAAAKEALATIGAVSRSSMSELRQILTLLRQDDDSASIPYEPVRTLDDLDDLVASFAATGLEVTLTISGEPHPVPPSAALCGYRVVQESLTNTLKHAGPVTASVSLTYADDQIVVEIDDSGPADQTLRTAPPPPLPLPGQHGLVGMRERTALLGGTVSAAPTATGGFRVTASIPMEDR